MKINLVFAGIALAIAALAGYGFYSWNGGESYQWLISIGAGIMLFLTLGGSIAATLKNRGTANIRVLSVIFFIAAIISNIIFSFIPQINSASYIIANGILLLLYILITYSIYRSLS